MSSKFAGLLVGKDRTGAPVHIGDTLSFDKRKWGDKYEFVLELDLNEGLTQPTHEIEEWCTVIARFEPEFIERTPTNDQIAAVMLQVGTPVQQREALAYARGELVKVTK